MASKRHVRRKCESKRCWETAQEAQAAIERTRDRGPQHYWFCTIHHGFHVGHYNSPQSFGMRRE